MLKPENVPFISYPYEWCFSQLKAAALLTLELQRRALARGMVLRDASAYNVQFLGTHPIFIDTLSFGTYVEGTALVGVRQFCQHFVAPLALMAHAHHSLVDLARSHIDGIPLNLACSVLPVRCRFKPGLLMHLYAHGRAAASAPGTAGAALTARSMSRTALLGLIDSLERTVQSLVWKAGCDALVHVCGAHELLASSAGAKTPDRQRNDRYGLGCLATPHRFGISARTPEPTAGWPQPKRTMSSASTAIARSLITCFGSHARNVQDPAARPGPDEPESGHWLESRRAAIASPARPSRSRTGPGTRTPSDDQWERAARMGCEVLQPQLPLPDHRVRAQGGSQVREMLALREEVDQYTPRAFERSFNAHFRILRSAVIPGTDRTMYLMEQR